jgi:phosphoribosylaminoimidazole-succinocarboxamide synthase
MQVRRYQILPLESIVRGYITGSAWKEYQSHGTVHGIKMPAGLKESQRLEKPIWTPSTKAEQGEHDENISPERAAEIVGKEVAGKVERASLEVYGMVSTCPTFRAQKMC